MSTCRVCLSREPEKSLIAPCGCRGSMSVIHKDCLEKWLKEKYRRSLHSFRQNLKSNRTGLHCELCKEEFKLDLKLGSAKYIARCLKESKMISSILINIGMMIAVNYKVKQVIDKFPKILKVLKLAYKSRGIRKLLTVFCSLKMFQNASVLGICWCVNILLMYLILKRLEVISKECYQVEIASRQTDI